MKINTKLLDGGSDTISAMSALFKYAKEVLGDSWGVSLPAEGDTKSTLAFTDSSGGTYAWEYNNGTHAIMLIYNGTYTRGGGLYDGDTPSGTFTGMVWQGDAGSIGVGFQHPSNGKYITLCLLVKFDGKYGDKDLYAMSAYDASSEGPILVHNNVNIVKPNTVNHNATLIYAGVGVYLHPFYDPVSGLVSSDMFGIQSLESDSYAASGTIVKQGGVSYMSVLGGYNYPYNQAIYVKM